MSVLSYFEEFLITSSDGITTLSPVKLTLDFCNDLKRMVAAAFPISNAGWVIVVSEGLSMEAVSRLEKQTTFISFGILSFNSLHTRYTDVANFSTDATIPSGRFF